MTPAHATIRELISKGREDEALTEAAAMLNTASAAELPLLVDLGNFCLNMDRPEDAVRYLSKADELKPKSAEVTHALGKALMLSGDNHAAIDCFERTLTLRPGFSAARFNLALALKSESDNAAALRHLLIVRGEVGEQPPVLLELADCQERLRNWSEAATLFDVLLNLDPKDEGLRFKAVKAHLQAGVVSGATAIAFDEQAGGLSDLALIEMAKVFLDKGHQTKAVNMFRSVLHSAPDNVRARLGLAEAYRRAVPRWHYTMLNDEARNDAYDRAIKRAVKPGDIVLDIGSGSGLLAMMAARAGAAHVYSCEASSLIAEQAQKIVAANGLSDVITVLPLRSTEMQVGKHLAQKADVLLSEIMDRVIIGEGMLPTLDHALSNLVTDKARILPTRGRLFATPVAASEIRRDDRCTTAAGFDVSAFNVFSKGGLTAVGKGQSRDITELGPRKELFAFDFTRQPEAQQTTQLNLQIEAAGVFDGVMIWFEVDLDNKTRLTNHPLKSGEHWAFTVALSDEPYKVEEGDEITVMASHTAMAIDVIVAPKNVIMHSDNA